MLLYIFQMRWKKFNIKILHIITFLLTLSFAFCGYFWSCIYVTISLYSSSSIIQYRLLPNQIFNIFKLAWLYWFHNGFEDYSICHLNWQCSGYNILSVYIYIYVWKLNQTVLELDFRAVKFCSSLDGIWTHTIDTLHHHSLSLTSSALDHSTTSTPY